MAQSTLLDIAKLNGNDQVVGLIEENLTSAPELGVFASRQIPNTSYYTVKRTAFPTVGFTSANQGIAASKSTWQKQLHEAYIMRSAIKCDLAVAAAFERGIAELEMMEADGVMRQAMIYTGKQIWYGVSNDAKGFPGIKAITPKDLSISPAVVDATGTTATTASSIYAVKMGVKDAHIVFGNNTTFNVSAFRDQQISDGAGGEYAGRVAELTSWLGLQIGNINCVGRICNITADSGKTASDALISQLLEKFPVGYKPDYLFMSRRSAAQLQRSRTVTINSGPGSARAASGNMEIIADLPSSSFGIPIIVTDSILNTDAIE
jgi:hypothetical protein